MNKLITPIYIKPDSYYYKYYNNYIKQSKNCESDKFILNLLKCEYKLINLYIYSKKHIINILNNSKKKNSKDLIENIKNNNNICCICHDKLIDNYIITSCFHNYCYKCVNHIFEINNKNFSNKKDFKNINCSICKSILYINNLYFINNTNKNISEILSNLYESKKNISNKEFIFKYLGYKSYYIIKSLHKVTLNNFKKVKKKINKKILSKYTSNMVIIINSDINWNKFISSIYSDIICFKSLELFHNYLQKNNTTTIQYHIYFTNNNYISYNKKQLLLSNNQNSQNHQFKYYQFIIKNTIDEKIFKGNVIIK